MISSRNVTGTLIGLTIIVIAVGGVIRIYDAGESCPDWPTCFGTWGFDVSEAEQEAWYEENPNEIDSRGSGHRYSTFQIFTEWFTEYWLEQYLVHSFFSTGGWSGRKTVMGRSP